MRNLSRFLWIPLSAYLLILIWLGQYSRPQVDDLGWFYIVQELGTKGGLDWLWHTNGGRFFSHLLILSIAKSGWPISLPWLVPAITIFAQWLASISLLYAAKPYLPSKSFSGDIFFYSLVLTLVPFAVIPQPATAIYWYTGAALYQWAYIAALFLITCFLRWMKSKNMVWLFSTAILLFCTGNTNELSSLFINISFVVSCYLLYRWKRIPGRVVIFLSIAAFMALLLNFSAPGIFERKAMMSEGKNPLTAPLTWAFWMIKAFWYVICIPLTWILAAEATAFKYPTALSKRWWIFFCILSLALLMILFGTGGSLAFRTLNALVVFLLAVGLAGILTKNILSISFGTMTRKWMYTLAVIATPLTYQMMEAAIAGPGFAKAYDAQWNAVQEPTIRLSEVPTLDRTMDSLARSGSARKLLQKMAAKKPTLLWFDEAENEHTTLIYMLRLTKKDSIIWNHQFILNDHYSFFDPAKQNTRE